jgi:hypothetical protein
MIADIWVRKNGIDIPSTTGKVVLTGSANASPVVAAWNYVLDLTAGDYVQLMWSTNNTNVEIVAAGATAPHPAIPSSILTVTQQSGIMAGTGITAINSLTGAAQTIVAGTSGTDFVVSSTGTTHTLNIPNASTVGVTRGLVSNAELSAKLNASDTSVFQRKQIAANSIQGNNTSAAANATNIFFKDTSGTYTGTITWGGTAPTSLTATYRWVRIGRKVDLNISLVYTNAGTTNTTLLLTMPSDAPTPLEPTGLTSNSNYLYPVLGKVNINATTLTNAAERGMIRKNSGGSGYEIFLNFTSSGYSMAYITTTYFTN